MIAFFEGLFGPCPYPALNVVRDGGTDARRPQPARA